MNVQKLKSLLVLPTTSIKIAMRKLSETAEKILFVAGSSGFLMGTVTDGDIRRALINGLSFSDMLDKVMCTEFISIEKGSKNLKTRATQLMVENKIEQIPVIDKNGIVIDVILWTDLLEKEPKQSKKFYNNLVVIMAGGKGTRLDPFTKIFPKPLIPIGDKTVIELIMEKFHKCGFSKFVYTLNYKKEYIKLYLSENRFPYSIEWVEEQDFLGTAGSISLLRDKISKSFFVANCDSLLDVNFSDVLEWHKEQKAAMTIIGCHNEVQIPFGVLQASNGKLDRIIEKPVQDVLINTGIYVLEPQVISYIPENSKFDMNQLIDSVLKKDKVSVYPIQNNWFDIGQWAQYKKSTEELGIF